ncbi:unnamed protein product [Prorocentrum cordatum]|uniref:Uncharacterized protein n=1 Tax=Prorocentrum cordatum TaxID=2364126 RepID=A0ABN9T314_9DINO|nr:unnamed protein product [Polarella glacialis]
MYASALAARRAGVAAELERDRERAVECYLEAGRRLAEARDARFKSAWSRGEQDEGSDLRALQLEAEARAEYLLRLDVSTRACPTAEHLSEWPEDGMSAWQGAACAGAALGALAGGVPLALCAAAGAAWSASSNPEGAAALAGQATSEAVGAARIFDDRHDVSGQAWRFASQAAETARSVDQEYDASGCALRAGSAALEGARRADREYDLTGKVWSGAGAVAGGLWSLAGAGASMLRR